MTTRELARICGVSQETIRSNAKKVGIILENGKSHDYTEDEVKKVQFQLMKNSNNQGNGSQIVKETSKAALELGALAHVALTSREAWNQFKALGDAQIEAEEKLQIEQARNHQLQLENKQLIVENDYLKKANDFTTAQLGYYKRKYHSWYDDYENY